MQNSLRPEKLDDLIGQDKLKQTLRVMIQSSLKQKKQVDHLLFHGQPGVGKTSIAMIIANEMGSKIRFAVGSLIEKKADLLSLFGSLTDGDVVFIDEIHAMNKNVEELIYSAMEDGALDIVVGPEGDSKIVRMKLPKFTLIGATTKLSKISAPLRDRFGLIGKLLPYNTDELGKIIKISATKLKISISDSSILDIASHSRGVPRIANNLLKRVNDFVVVGGHKEITQEIVKTAFKNIGMYKFGLSDQHINYLKHLSDIFYESWVSLDSLSGSIGDNKENIEQETEPILLSLGLIEKSSRGRRITNLGVEYITTHNLE